MSKLIVYRASAGSGKTYRLAAEYLKQVIKNPESYKNILAVTFTNKATNEMKSRILDELFNISQGKKSDMVDEISKVLSLSEIQITQRATQALSMILHDYSRFSISTIDSFVQRVIQALLWEIGEQGGVDIKLDTQPVLEQAADNLIDSASDVDELMHWIIRMGETLMDEGKNWDVKYRLIDLGKQIFTESFRDMDRKEVMQFTDKQNVEILRKSLHKLVGDIISKLNETSKNVLNELEKSGLNSQNFAYGNTGVINIFSICASLNDSSEQLPKTDGVRLQNALTDPTGECWVNKTTFNNHAEFLPIQKIVKEVLHPALLEIVHFINNNNPSYITAKLILKHLENLALIGDLWVKIRQLSKEEGFLLLNDSNHLLREFVKDSDAPFIYEKVGTRYDIFMIDEFQDTSGVQWKNFMPLVENSLSQDFFSMIVGDVKQSIYRWRNGDWKILATEVEKDFAHHGIEERFLKVNRRSLPAVVDFNNNFFDSAINVISDQIDSIKIDGNDSLSSTFRNQANNAYKDVRQECFYSINDASGKVEVNFIAKSNADEYLESLAGELPLLIENLKKDYKLGDIAILVRRNIEGQKIANILLDHNRTNEDKANHIAFISQDGLLLKASSLVRLMISALRLVDNPQNEIAIKVLSKELIALKPQHEIQWHNRFVGQSFTEEEAEWLNKLNSRPLQEIFEAIAHRFELFSHSQELAYLAELHEHVLTLSGKGGSDVGQFLSWWDENSYKLSLSVPESADAISILTIHKAKGLQFPVVIIPFADWQFRAQGKSPLLWVCTDRKPFDILPRYPIYATSLAQNSIFASEVLEEYMKEMIDNLNLLYVGFTRPQNELYIFSAHPAVSKNGTDDGKINKTSKLLWEVIPELAEEYQEIKNDENITINHKFRFGKQASAPSNGHFKSNDNLEWRMESYPVGVDHGNIKLRMEASEFFLSAPSDKFQQREHGKVMHEVFSRIKTIDNIDEAMHKLCSEGLIGNSEKEHMGKRIRELLTDEPMRSWFTDEWEIKNEATILTPRGHNYRPDRVMIKDDSATVVDFKFGSQSDAHTTQVNRYTNLLRDMGYSHVKGFIWYVDANNLVEL
jgi:ATP-dependent exoDNAse (exonuclease V) beta subunit